jgi:hypothetical protein
MFFYLFFSVPVRNNRPNAGKSEEQIQKEKYFQQQQAKLKQFGKTTSGSTLDPNKLVDSIFGSQPSAKPKPKATEGIYVICFLRSFSLWLSG